MTNITKTEIKEKGLSITFVAKKLNIPRTTLDNYLRGVCEMPKEIHQNIINLIN